RRRRCGSGIASRVLTTLSLKRWLRPCPTIRGYRGSIISGSSAVAEVSRSATAFNFCIQGQIEYRCRLDRARLPSELLYLEHHFHDALELHLDDLGEDFRGQGHPELSVERGGVERVVAIASMPLV